MIDLLNRLLRGVPTWVVYLLGMAPAPWLVYLGATGGLGVEPIKALEQRLGEFALWFLIAGLTVTPLRQLVGVNLLKFRRALGLVAFYFVCCHLLVWLVLDVQAPARIWADIVKRPYITIGMLAFLLLIPLAATSNRAAIRRLGPAWNRLHRLVYLAAVLGAVHFIMLAKGWQLEPMVYLAVILFLLGLRLVPRRRRQGRAAA